MNHPRYPAVKPRRLGPIFAVGVIALMSVVGATASAATRTTGALSGVEAAAPNTVPLRPLAVGGAHVWTLPGDGTVRCWGLNYYGELGDGTRTDPSAPAGDVFPTRTVTVVAGPGSTSALAGVSAITAGYAHTCALLTDGTVKCWGANAATPGDLFSAARSGGELGDGTTITSSVPVTVIAGPGSTRPLSGVTAVTAGSDYTCALLADGTAKCWGNAPQASSLAPVTVMADASGPLSNISAITTGDVHACALITDGSVKCWGFNGQGQLGGGAEGAPEQHAGFGNRRRRPHGRPVGCYRHRSRAWDAARPERDRHRPHLCPRRRRHGRVLGRQRR